MQRPTNTRKRPLVSKSEHYADAYARAVEHAFRNPVELEAQRASGRVFVLDRYSRGAIGRRYSELVTDLSAAGAANTR